MTKLLALAALLALGWIAFLLLQTSPEHDARTELTLETDSTSQQTQREPVELVEPRAAASDPHLEASDTDAPTPERTDASRITLASLKVTVTGIVFPPEEPILLRVFSLGSEASSLELVIAGNGDYEFEVTELTRAQTFTTPTLNLTIDHADFFVWDEMLDGVSRNDPQRVVSFETQIALEPLRAIFAGRVWVPPGHDKEIHLSAFKFDKVSGKLDADWVVQTQCDKLGNFRFRVEEPNDCILAAHSDGLRSANVRLDAPPGSVHENLALTLERGSTISGTITWNAEAAEAGNQLLLELTKRAHVIHEIGSAWFEFDLAEQRFDRVSNPVTIESGGTFLATGLEQRDYDVLWFSGSKSARHGKTYATHLKTVRAPALDVRIGN